MRRWARRDASEPRAEPGKDRRWLEAFMGEDHLPMPTFRLYPDEQAHVIAYLVSLRR